MKSLFLRITVISKSLKSYHKLEIFNFWTLKLLYICVYVYLCICTYVRWLYTYAKLDIGGFASLNGNHFQGKCEILWPTDLQYFWVTVNQFKLIANHFCKWIRKKTFFLVLTPFLEEFYAKIRNSRASKLRSTAYQFKKWFAIFQ